jgi:hypothetical protein
MPSKQQLFPEALRMQIPFQCHSPRRLQFLSVPMQIRISGWNMLTCLTRRVDLPESGSPSQRYIERAIGMAQLTSGFSTERDRF